MDPTLDYSALIQALFGGGMSASPALQPPPMVPRLGEPPITPPMSSGPVRPEPYMTDPLAPGSPTMPQMAQPPSLGAALEPMTPMPRPRPAEAPGGTYAAQGAQGAGINDPKGLMNAMKGVVAPPAPAVQKVSTPHAPQMAKLSGGGVAELLASLGIGPQQAFPGLKLPSTLGQALGG